MPTTAIAIWLLLIFITSVYSTQNTCTEAYNSSIEAQERYLLYEPAEPFPLISGATGGYTWLYSYDLLSLRKTLDKSPSSYIKILKWNVSDVSHQ